MDDQLKKDITEAFFDEYNKKEQAKAGPFVKGVRAVLDKADKVAGKIGFSGAGALLLLAVAAGVAAPPLGAAIVTAVFVSAGTSVVAMFRENYRAGKALDADIENGTLTARYHAVLDRKERELSETQDLYKAQRAQLPPKGAASESFAAAVAGVLEQPKAAAPAAAPASQPKA